MRVSQTLFGASETERLTEAAKLLSEVEKLVRDVGDAFVRSRGGPAEALNGRRKGLTVRGQSLPPRLGISPLADGPGAELSDPSFRNNFGHLWKHADTAY